MRPSAVHAILALVAPLFAACASWTPVHHAPEWSLYVKDGAPVDVDRFGSALTTAFTAVESRMGSFEQRVRVHAWDDERTKSVQPPEGPATGELQVVPGIGPARVRAYHVKGATTPFQASGVFLGTCDVGTAVHELVHARMAEHSTKLPLWFEEGLASFLGDGALVGDKWVFDGLACWPMRELRELTLDDDEFTKLLRMSASDDYDARENLLVHFVGWAIVFDLAREAPDAPWGDWYEAFEKDAKQHGMLEAARTRLKTTLRPGTEIEWLQRLRSSDAELRFASCKGLWKLRTPETVDAMLDALEREADPEVKVALALNILLATSETRLGRTRWTRVSNVVFPTLRETQLRNEKENSALRDLYQSMRRWDSRRDRTSQDALAELSRFWEE